MTIDTQRDPRKTERSYHKFDSSIDDVLKFSKWLTLFFQEFVLFVYGLDFDIIERIFEETLFEHKIFSDTRICASRKSLYRPERPHQAPSGNLR